MDPLPSVGHPAVPPILVRGVARILDFGVLLAVMEAAFRSSALLPASDLLHPGEDVLFFFDLGVGIAAMVTYTTLSEWLGGATLGKVLAGLRVVSANPPTAGPSFRAALRRGLAFYVDALFFGLIAYSAMMRNQRGQRVGDTWAGTVVVWRQDGPDLPPWRGWPIGVLAAFAGVVGSYLVA